MLLLSKVITDNVWAIMCIATAVLCVAMAVMPRVLSLKLGVTGGEMTLKEIQQVKEEIYAKARDLREVAMTLSEFMHFESLGWGRGFDDFARNRVARGREERQKHLGELLGFSKEEFSQLRERAGYEVHEPFSPKNIDPPIPPGP